MNQDKIKQEAKQILDKFAKALDKAGIKDTDFYVGKDEFERSEKDGKCCDSGFKKKILQNAPNHDDDFIIAEKGKWKE